jgi:hypothetical protein
VAEEEGEEKMANDEKKKLINIIKFMKRNKLKIMKIKRGEDDDDDDMTYMKQSDRFSTDGHINSYAS